SKSWAKTLPVGTPKLPLTVMWSVTLPVPIRIVVSGVEPLKTCVEVVDGALIVNGSHGPVAVWKCVSPGYVTRYERVPGLVNERGAALSNFPFVSEAARVRPTFVVHVASEKESTYTMSVGVAFTPVTAPLSWTVSPVRNTVPAVPPESRTLLVTTGFCLMIVSCLHPPVRLAYVPSPEYVAR